MLEYFGVGDFPSIRRSTALVSLLNGSEATHLLKKTLELPRVKKLSFTTRAVRFKSMKHVSFKVMCELNQEMKFRRSECVNII